MSDGKRPVFTGVKRVVLKFGSALLVDGARGHVRKDWLATIGADIARLRQNGIDVLVVSSGAVAVGRQILDLPKSSKALKLEEKQAAAAAGQVHLVNAWGAALGGHNIAVAQALLTPDDTETRRRWLNGRATFETLLALGVVPVVNENDTVATEELRYGDNDRLAARVAQMVGADLLILFSDIDGLYDADPRTAHGANHIGRVDEITPKIMAMAGAANAAANVGTGGMITKLLAAEIAGKAGCATIIGLGAGASPISALENGARHTLFAPHDDPQTARMAWLAASLRPKGKITLDNGAARALKQGGSLLPVGIVAVSGSFERGDAVEIVGPDGAQIGHGICAYGSDDAKQIMGKKSGDVAAILGYEGRPAIVHRDDLVLS